MYIALQLSPGLKGGFTHKVKALVKLGIQFTYCLLSFIPTCSNLSVTEAMVLISQSMPKACCLQP